MARPEDLTRGATAKLTREQIAEIKAYLDAGKDLPDDYKHVLFPPEKVEYELVYRGKERVEDILAGTWGVPLQPIRTFNLLRNKSTPKWTNRLIFGDNLQVMKRLLDDPSIKGHVKLVYIDPPFATKQDFRGSADQKAYQDKVAGAEFIEFLRKRLVLLRELLASDGCIYVHLDYRKVHYIKSVMDEVLGEHNFLNEIIWQRTASHNDPGRYGCVHDTLLVYKKGSIYVWNEPKTEQSQDYIDKFFVYAESPDKKRWVRLKKGEQPPDGWERYRLGNLASPHPRANLTYDYKGYKPPANGWKVSPYRMREMHAQGLLHFPANKNGRIQPKQYLKDTLGNKAVSDVWLGIPPIQSQSLEKQNYPTQKPEALLARVIAASSNPGDIVLDCFAGSGTALAVAEKLSRRWIGIDCGKLAIYTVQKRLLNLRKGIGNTGKPLDAQPFTLYNAGLYDFSRVRELPWEDYRLFALQLFQIRDEPHKVAGIQLDGYKAASDALIFNFKAKEGVQLDDEYVAELHRHLGAKARKEFFVVAPAACVTFLEDYIDHGNTRYYVLRIPYSIIDELHDRPFQEIRQPVDETHVNDTVDAVGFDFIQPPTLEATYSLTKMKGDLFNWASVRIHRFESCAMTKTPHEFKNRETLSMVMVDYDYKGNGEETFDLDAVFYRHQIEKDAWEVRLDPQLLGKKVMIIYIDIFGNELREVKTPADFGIKVAREPELRRRGNSRPKPTIRIQRGR